MCTLSSVICSQASIDRFFMGPSGQEEAQGVFSMGKKEQSVLLKFAVKSQESSRTFAHVVERRGLVDSTIQRLVADRDWLGLRRLAFKQAGSSRVDAHS